MSYSGLKAQFLAIGVYCPSDGDGHCANGASLPMAFATVHQASVTLRDLSAPSIGGATGQLTNTTTSHAGTVTLTTAAASDLGGGVRRVRLVVDGAPLGGVAQVETTCDFTYRQPCPGALAPQNLALDTRTIADGTHTVAVRVEDAGGNATDTTPWTIRVENTPPDVPGGPGPGGPSADPPIVWVDTDRDGTPDHLDRCPAQIGGLTNHGCPVHIGGATAKRTNVVVPTGKARYHSGYRAVLIPVRGLPWTRTILVRTRKGTKASPARLVRVKTGGHMLIVPTPRAQRIPTRVEWRPVGQTKWRALNVQSRR